MQDDVNPVQQALARSATLLQATSSSFAAATTASHSALPTSAHCACSNQTLARRAQNRGAQLKSLLLTHSATHRTHAAKPPSSSRTRREPRAAARRIKSRTGHLNREPPDAPRAEGTVRDAPASRELPRHESREPPRHESRGTAQGAGPARPERPSPPKHGPPSCRRGGGRRARAARGLGPAARGGHRGEARVALGVPPARRGRDEARALGFWVSRPRGLGPGAAPGDPAER